MTTLSQATNKAHRRHGFLWAMVDFYSALNAFLLLINIIIFSFLSNQLDVDKPGVEFKAEYVAIMSWDLDRDCDVDIWIKNPQGSILSFKNQDVDHMSIDRDDRGISFDITYVGNEKIIDPDNKEYVSFRYMYEGSYSINVHLFGCRGDAPDTAGFGTPYEPGSTVDPVNVTLELIKINPRMVTVFKETIELNEVWQEETMVNFIIDDAGDYHFENNNYRPVVVRE